MHDEVRGRDNHCRGRNGWPDRHPVGRKAHRSDAQGQIVFGVLESVRVVGGKSVLSAWKEG